MKAKYLIVLTFLLGNVFGCQGLTQNKNQIKQKDVVVKKTPLNITLNNEDYGTTSDTSILAKKLKEIFIDRGETGVFRGESNEIEKTLYLQGDRSASVEEIAKLFGAVDASGASPILIPVLISSPPVQKEEIDLKPNPLILRVYANSGKARLSVRQPDEILRDDPKNPPMIGEIEIGFMGELFENRSSVPDDKGAIAFAADNNGTFTIDGKQISASDLKTKIESRLKAKEKDKKIIYVNADNFGNIEDAASIAASAGALKVYVITKNIEHKEYDISFSLSPAYLKEKGQKQIDEDPWVRFTGPDHTSFRITLSNELVDKERAEREIKISYEFKKEQFNQAEVSRTEIDGSSGVLTIHKDAEDYQAGWSGFRKKNGKYQMVLIDFSSPKKESNYSHYEFLQIMKSIKLN